MSGEIISDPTCFPFHLYIPHRGGLLVQIINEKGRSMSMLRKDFGGPRDQGRKVYILETKKQL